MLRLDADERAANPTSMQEWVHAVVLMIFYTGCEAVLAFAFLDAVWYECDVGRHYPAFKPPVEVANFYHGKRIHIADGYQPTINVLAYTAVRPEPWPLSPCACCS